MNVRVSSPLQKKRKEKRKRIKAEEKRKKRKEKTEGMYKAAKGGLR